MPVWPLITMLGDAAVMLPAASAIALLLLAGRARTLAIWWSLLLLGGLLLVSASKIAFTAFGLHPADLDFSGISGHAMTSMAILPTLFYLSLQQQQPAVRRLALGCGIVLALLIGHSRLVLHAHSMAEVVSGALLGLAVCAAFVARARGRQAGLQSGFIALCLLLPLLSISVKAAPTQYWLARATTWIIGN